MDNVYKNYTPPSTGGGLFLKMQDDKTVTLRLVSPPYVFNNSYEDQKTGKVTVSTKYAWAVYNVDEDRGQILQLPVSGYTEIAKYAMDDEYGDPSEYNVRITRKLESNGFRRYDIIASPKKAPLTKEQLEKVESVDIPKAIENAVLLGDVVTGKAKVEASNVDDSFEPTDEEIEQPVNLADIPF